MGSRCESAGRDVLRQALHIGAPTAKVRDLNRVLDAARFADKAAHPFAVIRFHLADAEWWGNVGDEIAELAAGQ